MVLTKIYVAVPQKGIYLCGHIYKGYRLIRKELVREEVHSPYPIAPEDSMLV